MAARLLFQRGHFRWTMSQTIVSVRPSMKSELKRISSYWELLSPFAIFDFLVLIFLGDNRKAQFSLLLAALMAPFALGAITYHDAKNFEKNPIPFLPSTEESQIRDGKDVTIVRAKIDNSSPLLLKVTKFRYFPGRGYDYENYVEIKPGVVITAFALYLLFISVIVIAMETTKDKIKVAEELDIIDDTPEKKTQAAIPEQPINSSDITAIELLRQEIGLIKLQAMASKSSARGLLVSGVIMCFVGIGIFYATISTPNIDKTFAQMAHEAIRPLGMLIFIEALAWFLLKQHRSAFEEYVKFLKLSNRCANILSAYLTLNEKSTAKERQFVIEQMLRTNESVVLKNGETTEYLEAQKINNSNPVFDGGSFLLEKLIKSKEKES